MLFGPKRQRHRFTRANPGGIRATKMRPVRGERAYENRSHADGTKESMHGNPRVFSVQCSVDGSDASDLPRAKSILASSLVSVTMAVMVGPSMMLIRAAMYV